MTSLRYKLIAFGLLLGIAGVVAAYTPPTAGFPYNNTDGPLNIGSAAQDKAGGLSVTTIHSRGTGYFNDQVHFPGRVRGGDVGSTNSTVLFGSPAHYATVSVNGALTVNNNLQSPDLLIVSGQAGYVCADSNGIISVCN